MPTEIRSPCTLARLARAFSTDPYRAVIGLHASAGDVVTLRLGARRVHVLFGADANEWVLRTAAASLSWREAFRSLIPVDGDTALVVSDGDDHARRRRLVQPAFHRRRIDATGAVVLDEVDAALDALSGGGSARVVDLAEVLRCAIRRIVVRALFGSHLRGDADEIGDLLQPALDFVNLPPQRQIRVSLPGTRYRAALDARAATDAVIDAEIDRRRAAHRRGDPAPDDVLTMLLDAAGWLEPSAGTGGAGGPAGPEPQSSEALTQVEVRDQVVSLVAAGYDTTSAAAAWTVWEALATPGAWQTAAAEVDEVLGGRSPTASDLPARPWIAGLVHEALRLHPAAAISARVATEPLAFGGASIRRGDLVLYSPIVTHLDPDAWPAPSVCRPGRWIPGHPDHHEHRPTDFVPFGGGARRCLGFALATVELELILARLVQRTELELVDPTPPRPVGTAAVAPAGGVRVRHRERVTATR